MTAYQTIDELTSGAGKQLENFLRNRKWEVTQKKQPDLQVYEEELHKQLQEIQRNMMAAKLQEFDVDAEAIIVDGVSYKQAGESAEEYMTAAGPVQVKRHMYRPAGRGTRHVCALEMRAGIVAGFYTPLAAKQAAYLIAQLSAKSAAALFGQLGGMAPSEASLTRLPKLLSTRWEAKRVDWEEQMREIEVMPKGVATVAISLDGVMAPLRASERKQAANKPAAVADAAKPKQPKGPKGYQEIGCGTVSLYDADCERLQTVRYARAPEKHKATLGQQLKAEARRIFSELPTLRLVKLADGAKTNWSFLSELDVGIPNEQLKVYEILDYYHACTHLKTALDATWGECSVKGRSEFERLKLLLKESDNGVQIVIDHLRYRLRTATGKGERKTLTEQLGYFRNQRERMYYSEYIRLNLPIASGVVEASCKTLVAQRLKQSGMLWSRGGAQAILTLRALIQSDRWESGWKLLRASYQFPITISA
jgi:hypothetical protein